MVLGVPILKHFMVKIKSKLAIHGRLLCRNCSEKLVAIPDDKIFHY